MNITDKSKLINEKELKSKGLTYKTVGTTLQALSVQLDEGETILSEAGKMAWMTENIKMSTHGQGITKMFSRFFSRESIFVNRFTSESGTGVVTFTTGQLGKVIPLELNSSTPSIIFQKGAYLCSEETIERSVALMKKVGVGLFGGKGFILQKIEGEGRAYLISDGEVVQYELKENQEISVDQGNLVAYEDTVDFDIKTIGRGPMNWLFGGEGFFVSRLRGPGKVWLQTKKSRRFGSMNTGRLSASNLRGNPIGAIISFIISMLFLCCILSSIFLGNT